MNTSTLFFATLSIVLASFIYAPALVCLGLLVPFMAMKVATALRALRRPVRHGHVAPAVR